MLFLPKVGAQFLGLYLNLLLPLGYEHMSLKGLFLKSFLGKLSPELHDPLMRR